MDYNFIFFELRLLVMSCVTFEFRLASQPFILIVMITSLGYVLSMSVVVRSLGGGYSR